MGNHIQKSSLIEETGTATITIPAAGAGKYNCLTSLDVESDGAATVTIASPVGTTIWQHGITADESFFKEWADEVPLKGAENSIMQIAVSAGNFTANARGYVTP